MDLPECHFDGIFANARFTMCAARNIRESCAGLGIKPGRLQFCSNPWGNDEEGWSGDRCGGFTTPANGASVSPPLTICFNAC